MFTKKFAPRLALSREQSLEHDRGGHVHIQTIHAVGHADLDVQVGARRRLIRQAVTLVAREHKHTRLFVQGAATRHRGAQINGTR